MQVRSSLVYTDEVTEEELASHVDRVRRQGEDDARIEVKAAAGGLPRSVWESVSAFANTAGGLIVLGLDEDAGFVPAPKFDAKRIQAALLAGLDDAPGARPKVAPLPTYKIERAEVDGAPVVLVEIDPLSADERKPAPCFVTAQGLERGSYKRVGDADKHLTTYEVFLLRSRNVRQQVDHAPVLGRTLKDLDPDLVSHTISRVRASSSRAFAGLDAEGKGYTSAALQRINVLSAEGDATLAGYLTLGLYPQQEFPQLTIDVAVHPHTSKSKDPTVRFLDRRNCDGPLPHAIAEAVQAVMRNLKVRHVVEGSRGVDIPEIPEEVLREAIANAVMHRDYSDFVLGEQVAVDVYPDRVEVTNPGGFWGGKTKENVGDGKSASRNESLVRILRDVPMPDGRSTVCEDNGTGVPLMVHAMRKHGLPAPDYSASTIDHVVVRLDRFGLFDPETKAWLSSLPEHDSSGHEQEAALALARRSGAVCVNDLRANLGLDSDVCRAVLADLVADGLLVGVNDGPYVLADHRKTAAATAAEWEVLAVLTTSEPRTIREISDSTGKSLNALRLILRELVDRGLVVATAPPQSRNRKYLLAG